MVKVGSMYLQGEGVNANYEEAWKYFARAANKGNVDGLIGIGSLYREGKGVAEDYALAEEWFMKAVNRGSVPGMLAIGALYQEGGTNMGANYKRAAEWYKKAAYEGSKEGAEALAHLYFDGDRYFPKDYYKSYVWCCIADMAEKSGLATDAAIVGGAAALVFSGPLLPIVGLAYLWGILNQGADRGSRNLQSRETLRFTDGQGKDGSRENYGRDRSERKEQARKVAVIHTVILRREVWREA